MATPKTTFSCWLRFRSGTQQRLEVTATCAADARQLAFDSEPTALAVSCRSTSHTEERRHAK